jgi:hypothetical protein
MATNGRIEAARRRVASLKPTLALASVGVFAIAAGVARATDAHAQQASRSNAQVESRDDGSSFWGDGGGGSLAPAQGAPQAQTGSS